MAITYNTIPTQAQWLKDSSVRLAVRSHDPILKRIDTLLGYLESLRGQPNYPVVVCDLFFTLDYWLKIYRSNRHMDKGRAPAVQALYERVVKVLCETFNCPLNALPRELELMFGRELSIVGVNVDLLNSKRVHPHYLKRSELPLYKLYFMNGLAYQYGWWKNPPGARVLAESKRAYNPYAGAQEVNENYGFFVMSMGRDIYMMKHGYIGRGYRIFHSSYLAGDATMAAGSMLIERGVIKAIRSDSGHYQPTPSNMLALLQALRMLGVNLSKVEMRDHYNKYCGKAPEFFTNNAKWDLLLKRRDDTRDANIWAAARRPKPKMPTPAADPSLGGDYGRSGLDADYGRSALDSDYGRSALDTDYGRSGLK